MRRRRLMVVAAPLLLLLLLGGTAWVLFGGALDGASGNAGRNGGKGAADGHSLVGLDDPDNPDDPDVDPAADNQSGDNTGRTVVERGDPTGPADGTVTPPDGLVPANPGGGVVVNPGAGANPAGSNPNNPRGGNRNANRRSGVPHELLRSKPVKLPEFSGGAALTNYTPDQAGGLLGSYFEPQANPANGQMELAEPDQWTTFLRRFSRLDKRIDFPDTASLHLGLDGNQPFMARWDGYFNVTEEGRYAFFVGHTGDTRLYIDGKRVFSDNDSGIYLELFFTVDLAIGQHPVQLTWFHRTSKNAQTRLRYYTPAQMAVLDTAATAPETITPHHAEQGDTPASLAQRFYGTPTFADVIMNANPELVADDQPIEPGTLVMIPPIPPDRIPSEPTIVPPGFLLPAGDPSGTVPPILDSVEPASAEIGEEIVLHGRDFSPYIDQTVVDFNGQQAAVLTGDATSLRVIVPIGASSGPMTIRQGDSISNSVEFQVSTVFGLLASYYNLTGEALDFVAPGLRPADDVHVTTGPLAWSSAGGPDVSFRTAPLAARYEGRIGIPYAGTWRFQLVSGDQARVIIDGVPLLEATTGGGEAIGERYVEAGLYPIVIEATKASGNGLLTFGVVNEDGSREPWIRPELLFPPANMPAAPPEITHVEMVDPRGPAEGEPIQITVKGVPAGEAADVFVDGIQAVAGNVGSDGAPAGSSKFVLTVPSGVGNGQLTVRYRYLTSLPVTVPIRNVGLLGKYYDFPEEDMPNEWPAGFPDDRAVTFMRHDHELNMEGTGDFDLPFVTETFGAVWTGSIRIETAGTYHFWVGGDDGMAFLILGDVFTLDDGTVHYYKEIDGEVELAPGTYPIEVRFWENRRHEVIKLFWAPPGGTREVVPRRVLRMPAGWETTYTLWEAGVPQGGGSGSGEPGGE